MFPYLMIPLDNGEYIEGSRETTNGHLRVRLRLCAGNVIRAAKRITLERDAPLPAEFSRDPKVMNSFYNYDEARLNDALRLLVRG